MLDTIIVTPYHNDSIKFIPMSAKNIYDLPSSSMHRNIAISNFQLNFARQILSPHISDPSKKISPSTKQIIDLRVLKSAYGFYFITKDKAVDGKVLPCNIPVPPADIRQGGQLYNQLLFQFVHVTVLCCIQRTGIYVGICGRMDRGVRRRK